ncbi:probable glutathione S-transferase [Ziziphus jujuba]|uniref:glutathione transferase n=1 Tax=Ziziphus jujuba TaxID=326968 RepID=A0ABM3I330_ZIZJJ|nr:probable glutathione S-transferase [Ziziphus jujuba]
MAEVVKVFGVQRSPFSGRVEIALKLKGVDYEFFEEDLSNKSPLLLKYNPVHKKVPAFLHNGNAIAESQVILEYIDETWNNSPLILPKDPYDRAQARFWARFIDEKCFPTLRKVFWGREEPDKVKEELKELLKTLENELKDNKFFGGETIGFVDIVGNIIAYWVPCMLEAAGVELLTEEKYPRLYQWIHEFVNHDVVKETLPPRDELIAFYRGHRQSVSTSSR